MLRTPKIVLSTCCRTSNGRIMEYGIQPIHCYNSIRTKSNMFLNFNVMILLLEYLSLWNSLNLLDEHWPWNILWTDEGNFYLNGDVNTRNWRIWTKQISHVIYAIPMHVTVTCCMTTIFITGSFFLWRAVDSWNCYIHYDCSSRSVSVEMFRHIWTPATRILDSTIFMQNRIGRNFPLLGHLTHQTSIPADFFCGVISKTLFMEII